MVLRRLMTGAYVYLPEPVYSGISAQFPVVQAMLDHLEGFIQALTQPHSIVSNRPCCSFCLFRSSSIGSSKFVHMPAQCNPHDTRGILVELFCYYGISLSFVCRQPSGHEPSVQSLKQMFASHTAPKASTSSNSKPALIAEDDELDLDPEYAPKRALTTKVHLAQCRASAKKHRATSAVLLIL